MIRTIWYANIFGTSVAGVGVGDVLRVMYVRCKCPESIFPYFDIPLWPSTRNLRFPHDMIARLCRFVWAHITRCLFGTMMGDQQELWRQPGEDSAKGVRGERVVSDMVRIFCKVYLFLCGQRAAVCGWGGKSVCTLGRYECVVGFAVHFVCWENGKAQVRAHARCHGRRCRRHAKPLNIQKNNVRAM